MDGQPVAHTAPLQPPTHAFKPTHLVWPVGRPDDELLPVADALRSQHGVGVLELREVVGEEGQLAHKHAHLVGWRADGGYGWGRGWEVGVGVGVGR